MRTSTRGDRPAVRPVEATPVEVEATPDDYRDRLLAELGIPLVRFWPEEDPRSRRMCADCEAAPAGPGPSLRWCPLCRARRREAAHARRR